MRVGVGVSDGVVELGSLELVDETGVREGAGRGDALGDGDEERGCCTVDVVLPGVVDCAGAGRTKT